MVFMQNGLRVGAPAGGKPDAPVSHGAWLRKTTSCRKLYEAIFRIREEPIEITRMARVCSCA